MCYYDCEEIRFLIECDPVKFELINEEWEHSSYLIKKQNDSVLFNANILAKEDSDDSAAQKTREENKNTEIKQQPTSRLRKTLGHFFYLFADLEGYLFLKNQSYVLTPFLFVRNFYHYFTRLKLESSEEILKLIDDQTPSLPRLTQKDFSQAFKYYLNNPEIGKGISWVLDQQEKSRLKITRSCCEALQREKETIINEIIINENYVNLRSFFLQENMREEQKKVFLENLMIAHHIKEKHESCSGHLEHYSADETVDYLKDTLDDFSKEKSEKKISELIKLNQQMTAGNLSVFADEEQIHSAWHILLFCISSLKYANFVNTNLSVLILPGWWNLIFFAILLIIRISLAYYFNNKKTNFTKERIFLAEINETSRVESVLQNIVSKRFHYQQMFFLAEENQVIDLFNKEKQDNEENWKKFFSYFNELTGQANKESLIKLLKNNGDESLLVLSLDKRNSAIYHYVCDVNEKTQFYLILVTKAVNSAFCAALLIWGTSFLLVHFSSLSGFVWAAGLAASIASPLVFITLFLIIFSILALIHYYDTRERKQLYQRQVNYYLDKTCEYECIDDQGTFSVREITQWEKFECLRKEIEFLEENIKNVILDKQNDTLLSENYKKKLNEFLNREGIFEYHRRDQTLEESRSNRGLFEYIFSRLMVFLTGGSYGLSVQYSLCKGNFFFKSLVPCVSLPVLLLLFLPLAIVNGIVNLLVYHFHKKQEKKLFFLEHLGEKLSSLEDRKESLSCIAATLRMLQAQQEMSNRETLLEDKKVSSEQTAEDFSTQDNKPTRSIGSITKFFKHSLDEKTLDTESLKITDSQSEDKKPLPY